MDQNHHAIPDNLIPAPGQQLDVARIAELEKLWLIRKEEGILGPRTH